MIDINPYGYLIYASQTLEEVHILSALLAELTALVDESDLFCDPQVRELAARAADRPSVQRASQRDGAR